ncbi:MAG: S24/S26 family peptidase [Oscillospiraceae bacterium]|nr:S24/S26 family peptidase [Oscillospiraceae bacterium]
MALVRDRLSCGQKVRYLPFRGFSMLPMLRQGKDKVELAPLPEKLKKYDLPVYKYPSGKIVMHRVVAVREDHYLCMGDSTYKYETIYPHQMIGVVSAFLRGEKRISVDDPWYRLYCKVWVALFPLRKVVMPFVSRVKGWLRRHLR